MNKQCSAFKKQFLHHSLPTLHPGEAIVQSQVDKSRIQETLNLSTDAASRTDTISRGYMICLIYKKKIILRFFVLKFQTKTMNHGIGVSRAPLCFGLVCIIILFCKIVLSANLIALIYYFCYSGRASVHRHNRLLTYY